MTTPSFPPLMSGLVVGGQTDPFDAACAKAEMGCDAGLVLYSLAANRMAAALVFAPEVPLKNAAAMLPLCAVGFQNALGAVGPPELAVHLEWAGGIRLNGARCGSFRMAAGSSDPASVPNWLVVGFALPLLLAGQGGDTPDETALHEEGCTDVAPGLLLESWARHTLNWIARWESDGNAPLHAEWRGLAHGMGQPLTRSGVSGAFLGVDEDFGMLLRKGDTTHLFPLTDLLEG